VAADFLKAMSRKSLWQVISSRQWAEKICGGRFPQGNELKKFLASDSLQGNRSSN